MIVELAQLTIVAGREAEFDPIECRENTNRSIG